MLEAMDYLHQIYTQPFLMDLPKKMKSEHWTYPFYRQENTLSLTSMLHLGFKENWQIICYGHTMWCPGKLKFFEFPLGDNAAIR